MPYRGPPSKGCLTCRKRKIRCDQRPGVCLNCEKAKRECGGYRDAVDMMFLDETQEVTRKMKAVGVATTDVSDTDSDFSSVRLPIGLEPKKSRSPRANVTSVPPDLESQAASMFFTHFTHMSSFYNNNQGLFANLSPDSPQPSSQALYNAIIALGLITLHNFPPSQTYGSLNDYAEVRYLTAVTALNRAISDPLEVRQDATLLAVIILIMYETFAVPNPSSPDNTSKEPVPTLQAWSNHVDGAAAVLAMRGPEQFESRDGLRLFIQATIPLCVNCIQRGQAMPEIVLSLVKAARDYGHPRVSDPLNVSLWRCFQFTVDFAAFWAQTRDTDCVPLPDLVRIAAALDEEAVSAAHGILGSAPRKVLQKSDVPISDPNDDIMPLGYCHQYSFFNMAELSNGIRVMRLQINQLLRSILLIGMTRRPPLFTSPEHIQLLQHATDSLRAMSEGIIASVPQYLGYLDGKRDRPNPPGVSMPKFPWSHFDSPPSEMMGSLPLVRTASGCHLPWALNTVAIVDTCTEETRLWVQNRLLQIGSECNVKQAIFLGKRVKDRAWPEGWYRGVCPPDGQGWRPKEKTWSPVLATN